MNFAGQLGYKRLFGVKQIGRETSRPACASLASHHHTGITHTRITPPHNGPLESIIIMRHETQRARGPASISILTHLLSKAWCVSWQGHYLLPGLAAFSMSLGMSPEKTLSISCTKLLSRLLNLEISLISLKDLSLIHI